MEIPLRKKYTTYNGDLIEAGKVKKAFPQYGVARAHAGMGRRGPAKIVRPPSKVEPRPPKVMRVDGLTGAAVMVTEEEAR